MSLNTHKKVIGCYAQRAFDAQKNCHNFCLLHYAKIILFNSFLGVSCSSGHHTTAASCRGNFSGRIAKLVFFYYVVIKYLTQGYIIQGSGGGWPLGKKIRFM